MFGDFKLKNGVLFLGLLFLLGLTGCVEMTFKGTLKVDQVLKVKNIKNRMINLNPGSYSSELQVSSKAVDVVVPVSNKEKQTFRLNIPKGMEIPDNGSFELTPAQSGQPFLLKANVKTEIREKPPRRDVESCTYERWETICTPNQNGQMTCVQRPVTVWGRRLVTYIDRQFRRELVAELFDSEKVDVKLATNQGLNITSQRLYLEQGMCY